MKLLTPLFIILTYISFAQDLPTWSADVAHSNMGFKVSHKAISNTIGDFRDFDLVVTTLNDNFEEMMNIVTNMRSGEITYAVRDTEINGVSIKNGDFIGITKGEILFSNPKRIDTAKALLENMIDENREIITIFYGSDSDEDEIELMVAHAKKLNPDIEVDLIDGKQEIYSFIIAVE